MSSTGLHEEPPAAKRPAGQRALDALLVLLGFVGLGGLGGVLWAVFADPPSFIRQEDGIAQGEVQLGEQFGVDLTFFLVALGLAAVGGLFVGLARRRDPLACVLGAVGGSVAAGYLMRWLGERLGVSDPGDLLANAEVGATAASSVELTSQAVLLAWPSGALAVLALLLFLRPDSPKQTSRVELSG